jgi:signal transduction histidine kinase
VISASGEAALILMKRPSPDVKQIGECLTEMVGAAHNVDEIIAGLRGLFYSRAANRKKTVQVNDLIDETLNVLKQEFRDHGILLTMEFAEHLPPIYADRSQIQQVLSNLLRNAIEAMEPIPPEQRSLRISTDLKDDAHVSIQIHDSGPGISAEIRDNIFVAFFTTKPIGTGLGLSISKTIVERHGGSLRIDESNAVGTTFEIVLPKGETPDHVEGPT